MLYVCLIALIKLYLTVKPHTVYTCILYLETFACETFRKLKYYHIHFFVLQIYVPLNINQRSGSVSPVKVSSNTVHIYYTVVFTCSVISSVSAVEPSPLLRGA